MPTPRTSHRTPSAPSQRPTARTSRTQPASSVPAWLPLLFVILGIAIIGYGISNLLGLGKKPEPVIKEDRVSLVAVGDNLIETELSNFADAADGTVDDGQYDYTALYAPIKDTISNADISYINQEVHLGGSEIGPRGYPSFNCMDDMADCLVDVGFDFVASATNHSYDWGPDALSHSCGVFAQKPVAYTGTAASPEDAARIATIERNGITFALLNYTYGVNGYEESEIPDYAINYYHEDRLINDVTAAKEVADVVMVAMHWGTELTTEANEDQEVYAQLLADLGVDVILGSHPHCIQPMTWLEGKNGNKTLCAYSMGNFVSNHESPSLLTALEGMVSCDFVRVEGDDAIHIENATWTPLVCYRHDTNDSREFGVYKLKDMTDEMARESFDASGSADPMKWYRDKTSEVIGSDFVIDM